MACGNDGSCGTGTVRKRADTVIRPYNSLSKIEGGGC